MPDEPSKPEDTVPTEAEPPSKLTPLQNANLAVLLILAAAAGIWWWAYTEWVPSLKEWVSGGNGLFLVSGLAALVWGSVSKPGRRILLSLLGHWWFSAAMGVALIWGAWYAGSHGA